MKKPVIDIVLAAILWSGACAGGGDAAALPDTLESCSCAAGDLVVTEMLINPPGEDAGAEWVEIMNISDRAVPLDGLLLVSGTEARPSIATVSGWLSPSLQPGERAVLSTTTPGTGSTTASVDALTLPNEAGTLSVMCRNLEIASASWGKEPPAPDEGFTLQLAPSAEPGSPRMWCQSRDEADGDGVHGSPGRPNHPCTGGGVCHDAAAGTSRPVTRPVAGDIAVTEVFANPDGADTLEREWFEILALSAFDLAGLVITHYNGPDATAPSRTFSISGDECFPVSPGDIVVIGGPDGIPITGKGTLYNATGGAATITIADPAGNVAATAVHPKVPDGKSVSLKNASNATSAVEADDRPASWVVTSCQGGTPGSLKTTCARKRSKR